MRKNTLPRTDPMIMPSIGRMPSVVLLWPVCAREDAGDDIELEDWVRLNFGGGPPQMRKKDSIYGASLDAADTVISSV